MALKRAMILLSASEQPQAPSAPESEIAEMATRYLTGEQETDFRTLINDAFKAIRKAGYIAKQKIDAFDMGEAFKNDPSKNGWVGYEAQAAHSIGMGVLYVSFDSVKTGTAATEIFNSIVGLKAEWGGNLAASIKVIYLADFERNKPVVAPEPTPQPSAPVADDSAAAADVERVASAGTNPYADRDGNSFSLPRRILSDKWEAEHTPTVPPQAAREDAAVSSADVAPVIDNLKATVQRMIENALPFEDALMVYGSAMSFEEAMQIKASRRKERDALQAEIGTLRAERDAFYAAIVNAIKRDYASEGMNAAEAVYHLRRELNKAITPAKK